MSTGKGGNEDWESTMELLVDRKISPIDNKNKTWLRHDMYKSGRIDLMILEGKHNIAEIARKVERTTKDVKAHLEHLQNGNWRDKAPKDSKEPHRLKIDPYYTDNDIVKFSAQSNYKYSDAVNDNNNDALPIKEDFETAYRALTRLGERGHIDAILDLIETNVTKEGRVLKSNWRMITEENIKIWLKK
jgi:hypothetical protein